MTQGLYLQCVCNPYLYTPEPSIPLVVLSDLVGNRNSAHENQIRTVRLKFVQWLVATFSLLLLEYPTIVSSRLILESTHLKWVELGIFLFVFPLSSLLRSEERRVGKE